MNRPAHVTLLSAFVGAVVTIACTGPPLRVSVNDGSIVLDMQKLGEYSSNVSRLRLTDVSKNHVVWEVLGRDESHVGRVELYVGPNRAQITDVRHGAYEVVVPSRGTTFTLDPNTRYVVEAWGKDPNARRRRRIEFVTPGKKQ